MTARWSDSRDYICVTRRVPAGRNIEMFSSLPQMFIGRKVFPSYVFHNPCVGAYYMYLLSSSTSLYSITHENKEGIMRNQ